MKKASLCFVFSFAILFSIGQTDMVREIDRLNSFNEALAPLRFLASDELMGRSTTRPEIHIAARYISEQFRSFGLKEMAGTENYFQGFEIKMISPSAIGSLTVDNKTYHIGTDLLQTRGSGLQLTAYDVKYMKSYILAAQYIADNPAQPHWAEGDKYEGAWKDLYAKPK